MPYPPPSTNTVFAEASFDTGGRRDFATEDLPSEVEDFLAKESDHRQKATVALLHLLVKDLSAAQGTILVSKAKKLIELEAGGKVFQSTL